MLRSNRHWIRVVLAFAFASTLSSWVNAQGVPTNTQSVSASAQSIAAPGYKSGESWTYREVDGFTKLDRGTIVREVLSTSGAFTIVTRTGEGKPLDNATFADAGALKAGALNPRARGTLEPSLSLRPFPLNEGQRWSQVVRRSDGQYQNGRSVRVAGRVHGWETIRVPAGEFKALRIERSFNLGDQDAFRGESLRQEIEWYVPELKMPVKITVREDYREGGEAVTGPLKPQDWFTQELIAYKAGR